MKFTFYIRKQDRGLLWRHGDFVRVVDPGRVRLWSRLFGSKRMNLEVVTTTAPRFTHPLMDAILADPKARANFRVVDLSENQRALVWVDGRLASILGSGRTVYWNSPPASAKVEVEMFDVDTVRFTHAGLEAVAAHKDAATWFELVDVDQNHDVLLFRNGEFVERLTAGKHVFWKGSGRLRVVAVDRRERTVDVAGQEIMTSDKVTLRLNLVVTYRVADSFKATMVVADHEQTLYREAQLVLRAAVGTRTLDQLLADKESVGSEVMSALTGRATEFGVAVKSVGLRDIILPGEMKTILNQVIEAEKRAQAELIRRREETAAARSQANTARLLAESPVLARMRELELLKDVVAGTNATFVFGAGDLADQVRSLVTAKPPAS